MNITVNVQLLEGDELEKSSDEIAAGVLSAVGGDESKDFCQVMIAQPTIPGTAGTQQAPPPPPPPEMTNNEQSS